MSKKIGYCSVLTKSQLDEYSLDQQMCEILEVYSEITIYQENFSEAKERLILNEVLSLLEKDDILGVTKLDIFCRSIKEGLQYIDILFEREVKIHILNMGLIEDSPTGRLIVTNLLAFEEFERTMSIELTQDEKVIAKTKEGFKEGRPKKYTTKEINNALSMLSVNGGNCSYSQVEELLGISKSTLIRENNKRKFVEN